MKCSVSPVCSVPDEIVIVAPVKSAPLKVTVTAESTATAEPPTVNVLVVPDGVTTGAAGVASATLTLSAAAVLDSALSAATIEIVRVVVFVLVVENVTDCKAVWYWAGVALPLRVSTPLAKLPVMPF